MLTAKREDIFELVDEDGNVAFESKLTQITNFDIVYSGERILCADFTEFDKAGAYRLRIRDRDIEPSPQFVISESPYDTLLTDVQRYFYYQRANCEITSEHGREFTRSDQTPSDFEAPFYYDKDKCIDVSGGWYDAGDIGKYVAPGATAVNTLLWAYKLFPERFYDGQNNIPESWNGIPDILDEIRYELDFILKMQSESGGFYLKVKSRSENDGDGDRTVWVGKDDKCLTNATADCTAVCAFASTIFREFDEGYAELLLSAAERGWDYIEENPDIYTVTNYSGQHDNSSTFWAAGAMFYATGENKFEEYIADHTKLNEKFIKRGTNCHSVSSMAIYGYICYMAADGSNSELRSEISKSLASWCEGVNAKYLANPWGIAMENYNFWWGSFNLILGNVQDKYIIESVLELNTKDTENMSHSAFDFILGLNAQRKSYITGEGEDSIACTFSNFWDKLPKGYMPGGINNQNGDIISQFPLKSYLDEPVDWFTNENAIYWNAVMVFNTAMNV